MVLIAEQSYGKGRVVAFGDPSNVTNGITIGAHPFNARLYSYLTHNPATDKDGRGDTPQSGWRQILGAVLAIALVLLLMKNPQPLPLAGVVMTMTLSLMFWNARVAAKAEVIPDGRKITTPEVYKERGKLQPSFKSLAYIDDSHLGFFSEESWRPTGTMGLAMNLMRNDYFTLMAPDLNRERLLDETDPRNPQPKASLLVMPAPTRALSATERKTLHDWVSTGGQLVMTVGWDRYEANRELLADFKFYIGKIPLDALPPEVVEAVRTAKPGYEIVQAAAEQRDGFGYYVFDVKKDGDYFELLVHPKAGTREMEGTKQILAEKKHTRESWREAVIKRGALPPSPMGFFKVPYIDFGTYRCYVRFHAAWPIRCADPFAAAIASNPGSGVDLPLMLWRSERKGKVYLFGDSEFATNQNLENEGGQPFEGMRENADFWRWFLSYYVRNGKDKNDWWHPPDPSPAEKPAKAADGFELEGKKP